MKLRNKKTGEIVEPRKIGFEIYSFNECNYNSLAELNEEWEDYKEIQKDWWYIGHTGLPTKMFDELAPKYEKNKGGYTQIIKLGKRRGDAAEEVILQLV